MTPQPSALRRPNRLLVDLGAIGHNVQVLRVAIGAQRTLIGVLKADAYGFGVVPVGRRMAEAGVDMLALADLDAAVALREAGVALPILLYAGVPWSTESAAVVAAMDLTATIATLEDVDAIGAGAPGRIAPAYLKLDVGLERIGLRPEQMPELARRLGASGKVRLGGVYAHLHVPRAGRAETLSYVEWQLARFAAATSALSGAGVPPGRRIASSSGVLWTTAGGLFDGIDPGRLLYGISGPSDATERYETRPALRALTSVLVAAKDVRRDAFVELSPLPAGVTRVGVLPIGLVDGMPNLAGSHVLIGGRPAPIIGPPALEYTRVDLSGHGEVGVGAEVVVVGAQGGARIGADEVIAHGPPGWMNGLALRAGPRVERCYVG